MSDNVISLRKNAPDNDELGPPVLTVVPDPAPAVPVPLWVRSGRTIGRAVTHERTRAGARALVRHSLYVAGGAGVVARRTWQGRTVAVHHQMRAAAVAAGNHELAAEWQEKADRFRTDRHRRRMELITGVPQMAKSAAIGAAGTEGALLLLGACMAVHDHHLHDVIAPTLAAVDAVRALCWFIGVAWGPALALMLLAGLSHLWRSGQQQQTAPAWARPATGATDDVPVTPSAVVKALSDLGISSLRKAVKEMADGAAGMLGPITLAGCGVEVDVTLPSGVSTEEVLGKRRKLAENLNRHEHELHMTIPPAARTVRLWIADSGALDQPIGPSPLVTDPDTTADMHRGRAPGVSTCAGTRCWSRCGRSTCSSPACPTRARPRPCGRWPCGWHSTRGSSSTSPTSRASATGRCSTASPPSSSRAPPMTTSSRPPRCSKRPLRRWPTASR